MSNNSNSTCRNDEGNNSSSDNGRMVMEDVLNAHNKQQGKKSSKIGISDSNIATTYTSPVAKQVGAEIQEAYYEDQNAKTIKISNNIDHPLLVATTPSKTEATSSSSERTMAMTGKVKDQLSNLFYPLEATTSEKVKAAPSSSETTMAMNNNAEDHSNDGSKGKGMKVMISNHHPIQHHHLCMKNCSHH